MDFSRDFEENNDSEDQNNLKSLAMEYFQSGMERFLAGFRQQAKLDFLSAIDFDPELVPAYCYLSAIYCENDEDPDTAVVICNRGLAIEPDNPFLHFCLGSALDARGELEAALPEYLLYQKHYPDDAECSFTLACTYDRLRRFDLAEQHYVDTVRLDMCHERSRFNLGLLYGESGHFGKAIEQLRRVVELKPDYWQAYVKLGIYCSKIDLIDQAIDAYQKAVSLRPQLTDVYYNLGISYRMKEDNQEAAKCFKRVVDLKPDDADAWHNLGACYVEMLRFQEASDALHQAIVCQLDHEAAHFRLGCLYVITGDKEKAEKERAFLRSIQSPLEHSLTELIQAA